MSYCYFQLKRTKPLARLKCEKNVYIIFFLFSLCSMPENFRNQNIDMIIRSLFPRPCQTQNMMLVHVAESDRGHPGCGSPDNSGHQCTMVTQADITRMLRLLLIFLAAQGAFIKRKQLRCFVSKSRQYRHEAPKDPQTC